jgi:transposase
MMGEHAGQSNFYYNITLEQFVPSDHPLRAIRPLIDAKAIRRKCRSLYSPIGRPSIPPEKLIRAQVLQVLYSIRSERLLIEQLNDNLLFRWAVGLPMDDEVWNHSTFSKNRERLLKADMIEKFFIRVREEAQQKDDVPSQNNGGNEGRNEDVDYRGQRRSNETHGSTTDADARLAKKGRGAEARLSYQGHVLMENRNGLVVDGRSSIYSGTAERELNVTPHVARRSVGLVINGRTVRHGGYQISQRVRKRVEEIFGWMKTVVIYRKTRFRGARKWGGDSCWRWPLITSFVSGCEKSP